jgi:DNA-binding transcriptional LysR family regulator
MEINQLTSFYEIVKTGSFSKAARKLFITQSAVSHQIKNLERELGIRLFDRMGHLVKVTETGQTFSNLVRIFLKDLENLKRASEDMSEGRTGYLSIASSHAMIKNVLPNVIKEFVARFPGVKCKLVHRSLTQELLPMVLDGEVDVIIGARLGHRLHPKLRYLFWRSFDKVLLVPRDHYLSGKKSIKLADIIKCPLILFREGSAIRRSVEKLFAEKGLPYDVVMEVDIAESVEKYVEMGFGISIFSTLHIMNAHSKRINYINVSDLFGQIDYGIYYRKDRHVTTAMKQFIEFFIARDGSNPRGPKRRLDP